MEYFKSVLSKLVDWVIRPRNWVMKAGMLLMIIGYGGAGLQSLQAEYRSADGSVASISVSADSGGDLLDTLLFGVGTIGLLLILGEIAYLLKKRTALANIVIEHIALRNKLSGPLINAVERLPGRSASLPIDLSHCYEKYRISNPQHTLNISTMALCEALPSQIRQLGSKEITIHYGGTPPVSHGFLAGHILGNTYTICGWDYDRNLQGWYQLDGYSDNNKPHIDQSNYHPEDNVALIMSISHPVKLEDALNSIGSTSYVLVTMPETAYDNMSSLEKVTAFQREFSELLKQFNHDKVSTVHIFCAAQASFNFAMGRQITRNHPQCIVYEYYRQGDPKYPWGISLNSNEPSVVFSAISATESIDQINSSSTIAS